MFHESTLCTLFYICIYIYIYTYIHTHDGKVNSSSLAYNRRETRDKQPLHRTRTIWCHLHTSTLAAAYEYGSIRAAAHSMDAWTATKKALHYCGG